MHTSPASRSWFYYVLGPAFIVTLLAWSSFDAEAAPSVTSAPAKAPGKAPPTKVEPAKKSAANTSKSKKKTTGKKKNKGKKGKNQKKNRKSARNRSRGSSNSVGLISQIRRDEARLTANLSRLRKLLR